MEEFNPYAVKKAFVTAEVRRIIRLYRKQDQEKLIHFFYKNLLKFGYLKHVIHGYYKASGIPRKDS